MDRIKSTLLSAAVFMVGVGLISTAADGFAEKPVNAIIVLILGLFMAFAGAVLFKIIALPQWQDKKYTVKEEISGMIKADQTGELDSDPTDTLISDFRRSLGIFFSGHGTAANSSLQSTATQLYWHILYLQKNRMDKKDVTMDFTAERRTYSGISVAKKSYTDGKYNITDASERIAAKRIYYVGGRQALTKDDNELAHYSILNAKPAQSGNMIICPNCGNPTTRENLLDGCDYCGTVFTVEDLGARVSSFALRQDYQIAYDKYTDERRFYGNRAFLAGAVPAALLSFIGFMAVMNDLDANIGLKLASAFFGIMFLAASAGFFTMWGFWIYLFPIIQTRKYAVYYSKRKLAQRKAAESVSEEIEKKIRKNDQLFSAENFFSNVQNKLAAIHYADRVEEVRPFTEAAVGGYIDGYRDVVDMDVAEISLLDYKSDDRIQRVDLIAKLSLTDASGSTFRQRGESLFISMEKSADCRTEAVCGPSILRCRGCGASISLLNGGKCAYCGKELDLKEFDWVITDYRKA